MSAPTHDVTQLRAMIARRKRSDRIFSWLGGGLIALSLGVLGALMVKLAIDGTGRLLETHDVRPDGETPGYRDSVGTLARGGNHGWMLQLDPIDIRPESEDSDPGVLVGKTVALSGDRPHPGNLLMAYSRAEVIPPTAEGAMRSTEGEVIGTVRRAPSGSRTAYQLVPEPLMIRLGADVAEPVGMEGHRVTVTGRRAVAAGEIKASNIQPLHKRSFFQSGTSKNAAEAGILPGLVGTLLVTAVTMVVAVPLGVAAGIYLEEYAPKNRLTTLIEINIANLAGVPSIIWGLLGLAVFVYALGTGRTVLAAGLTLGLMVLPITIIATREAIRAVPNSIREAAIGLGATKWQTVRHHVIPYSLSGILTGSIIALSRAIGETAPLVCVGAVVFITGLPGFNSSFTVMPIQIFDWVSRPSADFQANAAAASLVLVLVTLTLNTMAIAIRYRLRKRIKW